DPGGIPERAPAKRRVMPVGEPLRGVEIDHGALAQNVAVLRRALGGTQVWAVVKADAYGHGAVETARTAMAAGAAGLVVATVDEGVARREAGMEGPILVLTPPMGPRAPAYATAALVAAVGDVDTAAALAAAGQARGRP